MQGIPQSGRYRDEVRLKSNREPLPAHRLRQCSGGRADSSILDSFKMIASRRCQYPIRRAGTYRHHSSALAYSVLYSGLKMNFQTIRCFVRAIRYGSKYIYQTVPRVLTIWLDLADDEATKNTTYFNRINEEVKHTVRHSPMYKVSPTVHWMDFF